VRPTFKVFFSKYCTCGSRKQCMGPAYKTPDANSALFNAIQTEA